PRIDYPEEALPMLGGLTPRWSREFARLRATRTTSSRNSRGYGLGMVHIRPAEPHGATDQMAPDHAAVPIDPQFGFTLVRIQGWITYECGSRACPAGCGGGECRRSAFASCSLRAAERWAGMPPAPR